MNSPMFAQRTSGNSAKAPAEPYAACGAAHGLSLPFGNSRLWPSTELYYANFSRRICRAVYLWLFTDRDRALQIRVVVYHSLYAALRAAFNSNLCQRVKQE